MEQSPEAPRPSNRGPYQYYQPAPRSQGVRRSYAERSGSRDGQTLPAQSSRSPDNPLGITAALGAPFQPASGDEGYTLAPAQHDHPHMGSDSPPANLRATAWTPDILPSTQQRQPRTAPEDSDLMRRDSVPEKSPLQQLEAELVNKEQKRAKVELAEDIVRRKSKGGSGNSRSNEIDNSAAELGRVQRATSNRQGGSGRPIRSHGADGSSTNDEARQPTTESRYEDPAQDISRQTSQRRSTAVVANDSQPYNRARDSGQARKVTPTAITSRDSTFSDRDAAARGKAAYERRKRDEQRIAPDRQPQRTANGTSKPAVEYDMSEPQLQLEQLGKPRSEPTQEAVPAKAGVLGRNGSARQQQLPADELRAAQSENSTQYTAQSESSSTTKPFATNAKSDRRHFAGVLHRHDHNVRHYEASGKPLDEWRSAGKARLTVDDLKLESKAAKDIAWWERQDGRSSQRSNTTRQPTAAAYSDEPYEEQARQYRPQLFTKCGPLLRYTGIRREANLRTRDDSADKIEVWHGSVMVITDDRQSDYSKVPVLRMYNQPMDLYKSRTSHSTPEHAQDGTPGVENPVDDPVAGQVKLSRTGRPLYVRPVHNLQPGVDLSLEENPRGLYAATKTPVLGLQGATSAEGRNSQHIVQDKSRIKKSSGESVGQYREVRGFRLHAERGWTFWRFNIEIELDDQQRRIAYRINRGPAIGFWIPARGQAMNIMFHSCNGFSLSVDSNNFSGPDPLWRDVLNRHQSRPFHVMIGGGDQIYNDAATRDTELFREWLLTKHRETKHGAEFSAELQDELEEFYLERYAMWFSQGLFAMANSQIPMVNIWDDHDIIDGYGSYPHHFMSSPVFMGLGAVAHKYYMLFQHQSVLEETEQNEPSWLMGAIPGPYIQQRSRSVFLHLGRSIAFLGLDCRTERMRDEILTPESYDLIFRRCRAELIKGESRHLIVLLGVPIAYPRLNFLENILTSRIMDPVKALGRTGLLGGFVNKFDGGVEVLDDLDDHWTAKHHKAERNWFIQELQELAADYSVRITILGGDVHLGAVGRFYTPTRLGVPKDKDHRYMPNVVSSAIVNTPPPNMMADVLNKRNKVHHLDAETDEDLIPMFPTDVDRSARNNTRLLPRRNYCTIHEYVPGSTPPPSPHLDPENDDDEGEGKERGRRYPPSSIKRTMSLTRNPATDLVRRLSSTRRKKKDQPVSPGVSQSTPASRTLQRANSLSGPPPSALKSHPPDFDDLGPPVRRPSFHRRPTDLSDRQVRKAAARPQHDHHQDGREPGHIDLEHGLDVSLNMEMNRGDHSGSTMPYRILIPALWYDGPPDINPLTPPAGHRPGLLARLASVRGRPKAQPQGEQFADEAEYEDSLNVPRTAAAAQRLSMEDDDSMSTLESPEQEPHRLSINKNNGAWKRGYELSGPPMGASVVEAPYPGSPGDDHSQDTVSHENERSLSPESFISGDDQDSLPAPPRRRQSKAERFFGITGDGGAAHSPGEWYDRAGAAAPGGRHVSVQDKPTAIYGDSTTPSRRASWKIWQKG